MRKRRRSTTGAMVGALSLAAVLALETGGRGALADERPRTSSAVQVPVQGGGGVEPVMGAPPPVVPALESRPARATLGLGPTVQRAEALRVSLRALSTAEGEATLEVDGVRETVRPGSRLGRDTVKSVGPGSIVLERPSASGEPAGPSLVIVTFDEAGRAKTRAFWTTDPAAPATPEAKRP